MKYNFNIYGDSDDDESAHTKTRSSKITHPDKTSCMEGTIHLHHSIAERNVQEYPSENSSPTFQMRAIAIVM